MWCELARRKFLLTTLTLHYKVLCEWRNYGETHRRHQLYLFLHFRCLMILGGTIFSRTYSSDDHLENKVASSWGSKQTQLPPTATYTEIRTTTEEMQQDGHKAEKEIKTPVR